MASTVVVREPKPVVVAGFITQWPDGRWHFPTLSVCLVCGGCVSIVRRYPEPTRYEPEEATRIALIQHGYYLAKWEGSNVLNAGIIPKPCHCGHLHNFVPVNDPQHVPGRSLPRPWIRCTECGHDQGKPDSSD